MAISSLHGNSFALVVFMNRYRKLNRNRRGIILLVVLSSLTFFSLLVAAYLVFSNQSRESSFVLAARNTRSPDVNAIIDNALMTLIRGTADPTNPFFGEDLLSDFYGRRDLMSLTVRAGTTPPTPSVDASGFARISISLDTSGPGMETISGLQLDDIYAGRIITFLDTDSSAWTNRSFRVLRSFSTGSGEHDLVFELDQDLTIAGISAGNTLVMNGVPGNSPGVGFNGTGIDLTADAGTLAQPNPATPSSTVGLPGLPAAIQPNHLIVNSAATPVSKDQILASGGDFDEGYDAADFNNWYLSYRHDDGTVIPSFHRPSVINYLLNRIDWGASSVAKSEFTDLLVSITRGTFRPLSIHEDQFVVGGDGINDRFTGGSGEFSLRAPLFMGDDAHARLNQFANSLILPNVPNGWDVDNDFDGVGDSVWINLGLPLVMSPEGKLLRPLVAPMIEDLSGRLNVNAHGNYAIVNLDEGVSETVGDWSGSAGADLFSFRGLGFGPADINFPRFPQPVTAQTPTAADVFALLSSRYAANATELVPGTVPNDPLSVVTSGSMPGTYGYQNPYGSSPDPYGRGGQALSNAGVLVASNDGNESVVSPTDIGEELGDDPLTTSVTEPISNDAANSPYEFDPTGGLSGDSSYSLAELEPLLKANAFDSSLHSPRLRELLRPFVQGDSSYLRAVTTFSRSSEAPAVSEPSAFATPSGAPTPPATLADTPSTYAAIVAQLDLLDTASTPPLIENEAALKTLVAPEIRSGNRMNLNRPFGNGIDDNANDVIDEPSETFVVGLDDDGDTIVDDAPDETTGQETLAFSSYIGTAVPTEFTGVDAAPDYDLDSPIPTSGRQMFARHLYVLMTAISNPIRSVFPGFGDTLSPEIPPSNPSRYHARRMAQWSVNVVDYRDADAVMTGFEYDENIGDGWDVDGNLATDESTSDWELWDGVDNDGDGTIDEADEETLFAPITTRGVVWGCESPELLFTESMALHDVRVRDTDWDTEGSKGTVAPDTDNDCDQVRVPEGTLLLELYCPRRDFAATDMSASATGIPRELYDVTTSGTGPISVDYELDLDRTVTTQFDASAGINEQYNTAAGVTSSTPVWRIAISEPHNDPASEDASYVGRRPAGWGQSPLDLMGPDTTPSTVAPLPTSLPDTHSFQPANPDVAALDHDASGLDELGVSGNNLTLERFIFFTDNVDDLSMPGSGTLEELDDIVAPITDITDYTQVFFHYGGSAAGVGPEQYLCLTPRITTHLGSTYYAADPVGPSNQQFQIRTGASESGLIHDITPGVAGNITPDTSTAIRPGRVLRIAGFPNADWIANAPGSLTRGIGLNVSEPLPTAGGYYAAPTEQYSTAAGASFPLSDAYVEIGGGVPVSGLVRDQPEDMALAGSPVAALTLQYAADPGTVADPMLGTVENYRTAFLQRLADPTQGYHPRTNPYRTVDQIAIDLTIFSGEDTATSVVTGATAAASSIERAYADGSRQRNGAARSGGGANVLFSYNTDEPDPTTVIAATAGGDPYFALDDVASPGTSVPLDTTLNFLNEGFGTPVGPTGRPVTPFAMHSWLNRPFASPYELLLVPACSQGRLFEEFSIPTGTVAEIYPDPTDPITSAEYATSLIAPYRHLLNFFHSSEPTGGVATARFSDLFEFVGMPPRFRGELHAIRPDRITGSALDGLYSPPNCLLEDNNQVGKINLNSIAEPIVWAGLMQGHLNAGEYESRSGVGGADQLAFDNFLISRRGYLVSPSSFGTSVPSSPPTTPPSPPIAINYDLDHLDPRFPTQFAGAFKSRLSSTHAPLVDDLAATTTTTESAELRRRSVNAMLLRGAGTLSNQETGGAGGGPTTVPLFVRESTQAPLTAHMNRDVNPLMRYQTLMRMPNLVSDNSQVFVIRLTLGFFEVSASDIMDPNAVDSVGREYKAEQGENRRYTAMFIVDRSIPVGFVPGEDLNTRDTVIYESYDQ